MNRAMPAAAIEASEQQTLRSERFALVGVTAVSAPWLHVAPIVAHER